MKKIYMVVVCSSLVLSSITKAAPVSSKQISYDKIVKFVEQEKKQLSPVFPYRINLFT